MELALKIWERGGLGLVLLIGVGLFVVRYAWPWFTERDRDTVKMFRDQGKEFTDCLKLRDKEFAECLRIRDREFGKLVSVIEAAEARRQLREDRLNGVDTEAKPRRIPRR